MTTLKKTNNRHTTLNASLGKSLRALRKASQLSQTDLGDILKLDQSAICRIERGSQSLSPEQLYTASKYFGISLDALFEGNLEARKTAKR